MLYVLYGMVYPYCTIDIRQFSAKRGIRMHDGGFNWCKVVEFWVWIFLLTCCRVTDAEREADKDQGSRIEDRMKDMKWKGSDRLKDRWKSSLILVS